MHTATLDVGDAAHEKARAALGYVRHDGKWYTKSALKKLKAAGVAAELVTVKNGGHGLNGYKGPMWDAWQKQSLEWLTKLGLNSTP